MVDIIKGNKLLLQFETGQNVYAEVTKATLTTEEADGGMMTFQAAEKGGEATQKLAISLAQSTNGSSLFMTLWDNPGKVVPVIYAPHGNPTPSANQPHFTGFVRIPVLKPDLGGEAQKEATGWTSDVELVVCDAQGGTPALLAKVTSGGGK